MQHYSRTKDEMILHYIARMQAHNRVGGNQLWKKMEMGRVVEGRTWQSMRNRFHRILINAIGEGETYNLTEEQIFLFINRGEIEDGGEEGADEEGVD